MRSIDIFAMGIAILMGVLFLYYHIKYRKPEIFQKEIKEFILMTAWLRAGMLFCFF